MSEADQLATEARQLLAGRFEAVLSTQSLEHPGYPFGSVVPYCLDSQGLPILLLSHLAQHARNLAADNRCGLTWLEAGSGDVQQRARLSGVGEIRLAADTGGERYFRHFPHTRIYFEQLGFRFFRFHPLRYHFNGGFATARWFGSDRLQQVNPFDEAAEHALVQELSPLVDHPDPDLVWHLAGVDAEGIALRRADNLQYFPATAQIQQPQDVRDVLRQLQPLLKNSE